MNAKPNYIVAAAFSALATIGFTSGLKASPRVADLGPAAHADSATFAGGCFWSMERPFQHVPGVLSTSVGYTGGHTTNPTYEQVNTRSTGHAEAVQVVYDPSKVSFDNLLDVYWHNIDPIRRDAQFCDQGKDYRTAIFYHGAAQKSAAERTKAQLQPRFKQPILTAIEPAAIFWRAEEYHQHFADRNPDHYNAYRRGCGRDKRLHELWGSAASPYVPVS